MKKSAELFVGKKDFSAFTAMKSKKKSTIKEIYSISIVSEGDMIKIIFHGNAFLHKMIRIITGTLLEVGQGIVKADDIPEILNNKVREKAGITSPAHGLCLYKVYY